MFVSLPPGTVGETYNVFLPYVRKDKKTTVCGLRVEYEAPDGRITTSPYTEVTLGMQASNRPASGLQRHQIKNISSGKKPEKDVKLESTTIQLPNLK